MHIGDSKGAKALLPAAVVAAFLTSQVSASASSPHQLQSSFGFHNFANTTLRTTFVAGGATAPALAYEGATAQTKNPASPAAGSIFGYFQSVLSASPKDVVIQYCQTASGYGNSVYDGLGGSAAGNVNGPCPALGAKVAFPQGFGAPAGLALTDPDVTASDLPLTQVQYSRFVTAKSATRGEPVELPELAGSIAIFYNNPDTGSAQIKLTDAQICGVVLGTITNWSQLGFKSRALSFVYRADSSGATFAFSNHLSAVCKSTHISTSAQFTAASGTSPPYVVATAPIGSVSEPGNVGVVTKIAATPGTVGFAQAAIALTSRNASKGVNLALVNGFDPIKNLPEAVVKLNGLASVVEDSALVTAGGAATTAPLSPAASKAGCVLLVRPSAYADLLGGYPIVSISYQLFAFKGNGGNDANLRVLAQELTKPGIVYNNETGTKNITTVDATTSVIGTGTTGYATLGSSFEERIKLASSSCINA